MTVRFRDASGTPFTVEIDWAYLPGEVECFVVGIREMGESSSRAPATLATEPKPDIHGQVSDTRSESDEATPTSAADSSGGASSESVELAGEVTAHVNLQTFCVRFCTPRFDLLFGGATMTKDMRRFCCDARALERWCSSLLVKDSHMEGMLLGRFVAPFQVRPSGVDKHSGKGRSRFYEIAVDVFTCEKAEAVEASTREKAKGRYAAFRVTSCRKLRFRPEVAAGLGAPAPRPAEAAGAGQADLWV